MAQYGEEDQDNDMSRRAFVKSAAAITASAIVPTSLHRLAIASSGQQRRRGAYPSSAARYPSASWAKPARKFRRLGVGGYHLGSTKDQQEANEIVARSLDAGINFFDNAWDYHDGLERRAPGHRAARQTRSALS